MMSQKGISDEIRTAAELFRRSPDLADTDVYIGLVHMGVTPTLAARLVEFLPMAYCRLIFSGRGVKFSRHYKRGVDGREKPLDTEEAWNACVDFAEQERGTSGENLLLIASRSAEFDAVNQLLNKGSVLGDIALDAPVLLWPERGPS